MLSDNILLPTYTNIPLDPENSEQPRPITVYMKYITKLNILGIMLGLITVLSLMITIIVSYKCDNDLPRLNLVFGMEVLVLLVIFIFLCTYNLSYSDNVKPSILLFFYGSLFIAFIIWLSCSILSGSFLTFNSLTSCESYAILMIIIESVYSKILIPFGLLI